MDFLCSVCLILVACVCVFLLLLFILIAGDETFGRKNLFVPGWRLENATWKRVSHVGAKKVTRQLVEKSAFCFVILVNLRGRILRFLLELVD